MQVGDLVKHKDAPSGSPGIVVDMVQKKIWRTHTQGVKVDWDTAKAEPHAVVMFGHNTETINIPVVELEIINEGR